MSNPRNGSEDAPGTAAATPSADGASEARTQMRLAIAAAMTGVGARASLAAAARALVIELRGRDAPPEQVLVQIKEILAEAGLRPSYAARHRDTPIDVGADVYRDVIASTIRSYYERDATDP